MLATPILAAHGMERRISAASVRVHQHHNSSARLTPSASGTQRNHPVPKALAIIQTKRRALPTRFVNGSSCRIRASQFFAPLRYPKRNASPAPTADAFMTRLPRPATRPASSKVTKLIAKPTPPACGPIKQAAPFAARCLDTTAIQTVTLIPIVCGLLH